MKIPTELTISSNGRNAFDKDTSIDESIYRSIFILPYDTLIIIIIIMPVDKPTPENATFCFLDFDLDNHRAKLARAAAFCAATDTRYGFSSQQLLRLGGAEVAHRVQECYSMDHEWGNDSSKPIVTRPPSAGNRIGE